MKLACPKCADGALTIEVLSEPDFGYEPFDFELETLVTASCDNQACTNGFKYSCPDSSRRTLDISDEIATLFGVGDGPHKPKR